MRGVRGHDKMTLFGGAKHRDVKSKNKNSTLNDEKVQGTQRMIREIQRCQVKGTLKYSSSKLSSKIQRYIPLISFQVSDSRSGQSESM